MRSLLVLLFLCLPSLALALPMYAQRSGRTCGNCHISPTMEDEKGWNNPELAARKCNMSCQTCHVNPSGGGLRNTSGRYYGQSTLSIQPFQERSYSDYHREILEDVFLSRMRSISGEDLKRPGRNIPSNFEEAQAGIGREISTKGWGQFGRPWTETSRYAFLDGRYGDLIADPLLQFGFDSRLAYWSASNSFFPMQFDVHGAFHPVEHLTLMATGAVRGRTGGLPAVINQERIPVFARNAIIMAHEFPYMAYAKAGIFMPAFGTHIDDHTSFIRKYFEMDVSNSDDTVIGVEVGVAPNYPYASLSGFTNMLLPGAPDGTDPGWGMAGNFGWRDLGWSLTGHFMVKQRPVVNRGNLEAGGLAWGFNPFYYANWFPATYMGEVSVGRRQTLDGSSILFYAVYNEIYVTVMNGITVKLKQDLGDRDLEREGDFEQRYSLAVEVSPLPGITLATQGRVLLQEDARTGVDAFVHLHFWY